MPNDPRTYTAELTSDEIIRAVCALRLEANTRDTKDEEDRQACRTLAQRLEALLAADLTGKTVRVVSYARRRAEVVAVP